MTRAPSKRTPVRIVCPHCRRTYVIQVDLQRLYRASPRAICSRCGGKFEVIQRMTEIDDEAADTRDLSRRTPTKSPGSRKRPSDTSPAPSMTQRAPLPSVPPPVTYEDFSEHSPAEPPKGDENATAGEEEPLEETVSAPDERSAVYDDAAKERAAADPEGREPEPGSAAVTTADAPAPTALSTGLASASASKAQVAYSGRFPLSEPGELRAPTTDDLERPFPWVESVGPGLEALVPSLPESVSVLELLLTERPRRASRVPAEPSSRPERGADAGAGVDPDPGRRL